MKTLTVKRSNWKSGNYISYLWDIEEGCGCILGHALIQLYNFTPAELDLKATPVEVCNFSGLLTYKDTKHKVYKDSTFAETAMEINDALYLSRENRESRLTNLFHKNNIKLIFED